MTWIHNICINLGMEVNDLRSQILILIFVDYHNLRMYAKFKPPILILRTKRLACTKFGVTKCRFVPSTPPHLEVYIFKMKCNWIAILQFNNVLFLFTFFTWKKLKQSILFLISTVFFSNSDWDIPIFII